MNQKTALTNQDNQSIRAFTFGEPESVLDKRDLSQYLEIWHNGKYYEPSVSPRNLNAALHMTPAHESAIRAKTQLLASSFIPHPKLSRSEFKKFVLDRMIHGNAYFEVIPNRLGKPLRLQHAPTLNMRVGINPNEYYFISNSIMVSDHIFTNPIIHSIIPDPNQEIYGMPEYFSAMNSGLLNEEATLFRRRYYKNGSHAGFIFYLSEATVSDADAEAIEESLKGSKGVGNFKNLFIHAPNGDADGVKIIPISEVAAKDEFMNIKDVSRDDILTAHRMPPVLLGIVPKNTGGFGDIRSAAIIFHFQEIQPIQDDLLEINDILGEEVIRFKPYKPPQTANNSPTNAPNSA